MMVAAELSHKSEELEKFKKESALKGNMPDGIFGEKLLAEMESQKNLILAKMGENLVSQIKESWSYQAKIQDIQIDRGADSKWTLSGTLDWCNSENLDNISEMITVSSSYSKTTLDKFLSPYVKALAVIAQRASTLDANSEQTVKISIYNTEATAEPSTATVSMTPQKATETLQEIYTAAFGNETERPYSKAVPASLLDTQGITNIRAFKDKLLDCWKYFDKKSLFDPITDVGFEANNFTYQWSEAIKKMRSLMQITVTENAKKRKA